MDNTTLAGMIAALFALTTAMLTALTLSQKTVVEILQSALASAQSEKLTCYAENKVTIDKAYALVSAFGELKVVTVDSAGKITKIERALEELQRNLSHRRES